jgi:hypothetical protein
MSNKLNSLNYNNNIKQKNKSKFYKSKELMEDYESKLKEWIKLENRDFHNYLKRKYVDCDNLKDLLIATNSIENIVDNLSSVESEIESSIIIDSFINLYKKSFIASMDEKGVYFYIFIHVHICMYVYMNTYICIFVHAFVHVYIHLYVHIYMYACIYSVIKDDIMFVITYFITKFCYYHLYSFNFKVSLQ